MPPELTDKAWAQIRSDYEHTDRPVEDICAEHGISSGTLRDRMRRWGWTRRRPPIRGEGPPALAPAPPIDAAAPSPAAQAAAGDDTGAPGESNDSAIALRLQSAVARVVPAIEAIVAKLGAASTPPREMERAARALAALTRTLRELNSLLSQRQAAGAADGRCAHCDDMPEDIDEFRRELARRINAFVASRTGQAVDGVEP